ncbi:MAG TPA: DUF2804 domain-containing protein [Geothrix sp.]|nr:DUF2804 domain-containing protein [Geothrix sp.]
MNLVDERGQVKHGCFDGPVQLNAGAFRLRDFFGREVGSLHKRLALGGFNFVGFTTDEVMVGLAAVRLGYASQVFGYLYDFKTRQLFEKATKALPSSMAFPLEPDAHRIKFAGSGCALRIDKSHPNGLLELEAEFGGSLHIQARLPYGFDQKPLRVVNPSCGDPFRFTFTEKCSPLQPEQLSVRFNGVERTPDANKALAIYDWSAGYFNRHTNWLWAACAGRLPGGQSVGLNFAALANESFYPENACWIDGDRTRVPRIIFDYDLDDPYARDWRVFSEDGQVDLTFRPVAERSEKSRLPFLKVNFRQFMGAYSGTLRTAKGATVTLDSLHGLAELHLSVW